MIDIKEISSGLELGDDGIWHATEDVAISYPSDGNVSCYEVESKSFWFNHRNNCISSVVSSYPPMNNGTIFDIGGGNGFVSLGLSGAGYNVALVEPGLDGALNAKKRGVENVICATTETANLKQGSLPAVGLFDVVEHIEHDVDFLKKVRSLLSDDGRLYITVPAYQFLWSKEDVSAGHFRRYTTSSVEHLLTKAGFEVEFSSYIFRFLPIPILLLRSIPFRLGLAGDDKNNGSKSVSEDHSLNNSLVTRITNWLMGDEIRRLEKKIKMRFGGSCIVVAKCP